MQIKMCRKSLCFYFLLVSFLCLWNLHTRQLQIANIAMQAQEMTKGPGLVTEVTVASLVTDVARNTRRILNSYFTL